MGVDDAPKAEHPGTNTEQARPAVIGEQQSRVDYAANRFGAETYPGLTAEEAGLAEGSAELKAAQLAHNKDWINRMKEEGRLIIDTGPAEPRGSYPEPTRPGDWPQAPYEAELDAVKDYGNVIRPWEDMTGDANFPWKYDPATYYDGFWHRDEGTPATDAAAGQPGHTTAPEPLDSSEAEGPASAWAADTPAALARDEGHALAADRAGGYAAHVLENSGFSPPGRPADGSAIHEYDPMADAGVPPGERMQGGELPAESLGALGFNPADGAYAGATGPQVRDVLVEKDLWLAQYYDGSKDVDSGRTLKFWRPIEVSQIPELAGADEVARTLEGNAILSDWGPRTHVQVACIPAGTTISCIESPTAPQASGALTDLLASPGDPATGDLRPELQPDRILESIGDVRLGGAGQIAFARFDERWIRGQRELPA